MAANLQIDTPMASHIGGMPEQPSSSVMSKYWYVVSFVLLVLYLTYFHLLNGADEIQVRYLGAAFSAAWLSVCFIAQSCFRNRFEFAIHTIVTLDFVLESLIDSHSGYGFYLCALAFWALFWVYHHLPARPVTS